jgi:Protein of unknown function (DUF4231)
MTILETVALDQERWWSTALAVKGSNHARFTLMVEMTLAAAVLEVLAFQLHASYPIASQIAGYTGVLALIVVLAIRARGLDRERLQGWVLAAAAAHALKSEMYQYRTSCGPYANNGDPDGTLSRRRDEILARVSPIRRYLVEPAVKTAAVIGPLDAEAYISERVKGEITKFQQFTRNLNGIQDSWLKKEYFLLLGGTLLGAALTFTHNQTYSAWIAVVALLSLASGVTTKSERYATLVVECKAMPERLTTILEQWRTTHGTLDQLVARVETLVLAQAQAWVLGDIAVPEAAELSPAPIVPVPAARARA